MTHQTILISLLLFVTVHTPAHFQRRHLLNPFHLLDLAVAALTFESSSDMAFMAETGKAGQLVYAEPGDRFFAFPVVLDFKDLRLIGYVFMTANTRLDGRNTSPRGDASGIMAVQTVEAILPGVQFMTKGDWLSGSVAPSRETQIDCGKVPPRGFAIIPHALCHITRPDRRQDTRRNDEEKHNAEIGN